MDGAAATLRHNATHQRHKHQLVSCLARKKKDALPPISFVWSAAKGRFFSTQARTTAVSSRAVAGSIRQKSSPAWKDFEDDEDDDDDADDKDRDDDHQKWWTDETTQPCTLSDMDASSASAATVQSMNLCNSVNAALATALRTDPTAIVFGQDVAFGGVFRCTLGLQDEFGKDRVYNAPLNENGIVGMAIGYASQGGTAIAEVQFADYIFPALDQIVNEMAKFRYRSGSQWDCGGVTIRMPCGAVGHGGHYHSQSPEAYLTHTPGIRVVMPRGPKSAKGLLLASIRSPDPVIFLEPKILYRSSTEDVPLDDDFEIPLGQAEIIRSGTDLTIVGWGGHLRKMQQAAETAYQTRGISCEVLDLQSLLPWDVEAVCESVRKTGRLLVSHEAPVTCGLGAEILATVQSECFVHLEAPPRRLCGFDTPFPLVFEEHYVPSKERTVQAIYDLVDFVV